MTQMTLTGFAVWAADYAMAMPRIITGQAVGGSGEILVAMAVAAECTDIDQTGQSSISSEQLSCDLTVTPASSINN